MRHMVNKAYTRWVAANVISGHLVHAGNHRHGTALLSAVYCRWHYCCGGTVCVVYGCSCAVCLDRLVQQLTSRRNDVSETSHEGTR